MQLQLWTALQELLGLASTKTCRIVRDKVINSQNQTKNHLTSIYLVSLTIFTEKIK